MTCAERPQVPDSSWFARKHRACIPAAALQGWRRSAHGPAGHTERWLAPACEATALPLHCSLCASCLEAQPTDCLRASKCRTSPTLCTNLFHWRQPLTQESMMFCSRRPIADEVCLPGCCVALARLPPSRRCSASSLRLLAEDIAGLGLAALSPICPGVLLLRQCCRWAGFAGKHGGRQALRLLGCSAEVTNGAAGAPGAARHRNAGILRCSALAAIRISQTNCVQLLLILACKHSTYRLLPCSCMLASRPCKTCAAPRSPGCRATLIWTARNATSTVSANIRTMLAADGTRLGFVPVARSCDPVDVWCLAPLARANGARCARWAESTQCICGNARAKGRQAPSEATAGRCSAGWLPPCAASIPLPGTCFSSSGAARWMPLLG